MTAPKIKLHKGDLPAGLSVPEAASRSTPKRSGSIRIATACASCSSRAATARPISSSSTARTTTRPRLKALLTDPKTLKIFHFARFDVAVLEHYLGVETSPIYCTKIASKLARTYTDRHGLKDLAGELLGHRAFKAAAEQRLGRSRTFRQPEGLCRQ